MFKKHIIFQILYIIVGLLCPTSLKRFVFYKAPPSDKSSLLWLASWHCIVIGRTPQACVGYVIPLTIIASFSFQSKYKELVSTVRATDSRVRHSDDAHVFAVHKTRLRQLTPLWCEPVSLYFSLSLSISLSLSFSLSLSLSLSLSHTHTHTEGVILHCTKLYIWTANTKYIITKHTYCRWFRIHPFFF